MIRILGVISGAAISIAALTWFVGVPQFTSERVVDDSSIGVPPVMGSEAAWPAPSDPEDSAESAQPNEALAEAVPDVVPEPIEIAEVVEKAEAVPTAIDAALDEIIVPPPELNWFAFWSPFRSEIAANGFVAELQRVTGLDYRVVKVKPGVYEVAFAYSEDDEINSNLSTISAATGLNLPGAR